MSNRYGNFGTAWAEAKEQMRLARESLSESSRGQTRDKPETEEEKRARWARLYPATDSAGTLAADIVEDRMRQGKTRTEIIAELEHIGLPIPEDWQ